MSDDKPVDHVADCAESLWRIAESLEQIANILESCRSQLAFAGGDNERYAFRTIPLTD